MKRPLQYFRLSEFDSPDDPGSGAREMDEEFVYLLDRARHASGVPYRITSGFRTQEYHDDLTKRGYPTAKNSSHLRGLAADIQTNNSRERYLILRGLFSVGLNRVGIGRTFIHVDNDTEKTEDLTWVY